MIKPNVIISAVGASPREHFLYKWLASPASKKFSIFLITDHPELFPSEDWPNIEAYQYFGSRYNYHDKLIYALQLITMHKIDAFIWDVDELHLLDKSVHLYDTTIKIPQIGRHWFEEATLAHKKTDSFNYLRHYANDMGIAHHLIAPIQEDKLWFPSGDYTKTIKILEDIKAIVHIKEGKHFSKWYTNGAGEGLALSFGLHQSKITYRKVGEYIK